MNGLDDATQWHEEVGHLVQAHGADPDGLIGYAPTLEQLHFAHADTHVALASIGMLPPDRHTHPLPMNAGWPDARKTSYRPFRPAPQARDDPFFFPLPYQTGLPQTWRIPDTETGLADWAAGQPFTDLTVNSHSIASIKRTAAGAAAAWAARISFPSPVQTRPPAPPGRSNARQLRRQIPRQARGR
jgi:hypothetical protein